MNKTLNFLKLSTMALLAMGLFTFGTCSDDDDGEETGTISQKEFAEQYFSVQNGKYHNSDMPKSTGLVPLSGVEISSQVEAGETTYITISSDVEYNCFYVGVQDVPGYMEYTASTRASSFSYRIPITFGVINAKKLTLIIKGLTKNGDVTPAYKQSVSIENFGTDIGTNNSQKAKGKWRYEYEQDDDMGTVREDYWFEGGSSEVADYTLDAYSVDDGGIDEAAWRYQVEGQYRLKGSTLHLYARRTRVKQWNKDWTEWSETGGGLSPRLTWKSTYSDWSEYLEKAEGELWECIINDAKTEMQWRKLKAVYEGYDPVKQKDIYSYNYDENVPIRHLKKI